MSDTSEDANAVKDIEFTPMLWSISSLVEMRGRYSMVFCRCSCGSTAWVRRSSLGVDSFGCKKCRNGMRTHASSNTRLYNSWVAMKQRCLYKRSIGFSTYGGRGISVCEDWIKSFEKFQTWALANGYTEGLSIDRIDPNGNYEPSNCRWVTQAEQCRNTCRNIFVERDGRRMVLKDWCRELDLCYDTVRSRIYAGSSPEMALLSPTNNRFVDRKKASKKKSKNSSDVLSKVG